MNLAIHESATYRARNMGALALQTMQFGRAAWALMAKTKMLIAVALLIETSLADAEPVPPTDMVLIRGGDLPMGSEVALVEKAFRWCRELNPECKKDTFLLELPPREATVKPFFLDRTEVTNADFVAWLTTVGGVRVEAQRFVRIQERLLADLHTSGSGLHWSVRGLSVRAGHERRPATQVTYHAADSYCRFRGKRLPREAEWEMAARGAEGRLFPWGEDRPTCEDAVFARAAGGVCTRFPRPQDVGQARRDKTPEGVVDLAGNVAEWTSDYLGDRLIVRGGDFGRSAPYLRTTTRTTMDPGTLYGNVGFRCARSLTKDQEQ